MHSSIQGGVEFFQDVRESVPQVLLTDPNFIKHIISNLLSNALRFTHQGKVSVFISVADATSMKAHELVEVQPGITLILSYFFFFFFFENIILIIMQNKQCCKFSFQTLVLESIRNSILKCFVLFHKWITQIVGNTEV